jgi:hypothetical protein
VAELKKKTRGPRKKSSRAKGKSKNPAVSSALKILWATPEFREKMKQRDANRIAAAKLNPEKFWRRGVPDGMRKRDAAPLWDRANQLADRFIQIMKDVGELPADEHVVVKGEDGEDTLVTVPATDAGKAEAALRQAFVLAVGPSTQQVQIQAINTVLNFTKSKPESKSKLTLNKAEDFLAAVAEDMKNDG